VAERKTFELSVPFLEPVSADTSGSCISFCNNNIQVDKWRGAITVRKPFPFYHLKKGEWPAILWLEVVTL
jgi:hypothetical protein